MSQSARQVVTGVVVNRHLNVSRPQFDRLKAAIHACGAQPPDPAAVAALDGEIAGVETLNPARGAKPRRLLARALART